MRFGPTSTSAGAPRANPVATPPNASTVAGAIAATNPKIIAARTNVPGRARNRRAAAANAAPGPSARSAARATAASATAESAMGTAIARVSAAATPAASGMDP